MPRMKEQFQTNCQNEIVETIDKLISVWFADQRDEPLAPMVWKDFQDKLDMFLQSKLAALISIGDIEDLKVICDSSNNSTTSCIENCLHVRVTWVSFGKHFEIQRNTWDKKTVAYFKALDDEAEKAGARRLYGNTYVRLEEPDIIDLFIEFLSTQKGLHGPISVVTPHHLGVNTISLADLLIKFKEFKAEKQCSS